MSAIEVFREVLAQAHASLSAIMRSIAFSGKAMIRVRIKDFTFRAHRRWRAHLNVVKQGVRTFQKSRYPHSLDRIPANRYRLRPASAAEGRPDDS
jgi:hypothetical protein